MYDHAGNTHWQMPGVSQRHRPYVQQRSNTYFLAIGIQQQVREATAANQVRRMLLLACRTGCMELTAT